MTAPGATLIGQARLCAMLARAYWADAMEPTRRIFLWSIVLAGFLQPVLSLTAIGHAVLALATQRDGLWLTFLGWLALHGLALSLAYWQRALVREHRFAQYVRSLPVPAALVRGVLFMMQSLAVVPLLVLLAAAVSGAAMWLPGALGAEAAVRVGLLLCSLAVVPWMYFQSRQWGVLACIVCDLLLAWPAVGGVRWSIDAAAALAFGFVVCVPVAGPAGVAHGGTGGSGARFVAAGRARLAQLLLRRRPVLVCYVRATFFQNGAMSFVRIVTTCLVLWAAFMLSSDPQRQLGLPFLKFALLAVALIQVGFFIQLERSRTHAAVYLRSLPVRMACARGLDLLLIAVWVTFLLSPFLFGWYRAGRLSAAEAAYLWLYLQLFLSLLRVLQARVQRHLVPASIALAVAFLLIA